MPLPRESITELKAAQTYLRKALEALRAARPKIERFTQNHPSLDGDEADRQSALADNHLCRAVEFIDEAAFRAQTIGASGFAA